MIQDQDWGSDGPISLPQALENTAALKVDMEGFVFTPYGLRVNVSVVDREEILGSGYRPPLRGGDV